MKMNRLKFVEDDQVENIFRVYNKQKQVLGNIQYSFNWKKYAFYPSDISFFDIDCLQEIIDFIKKIK